MEQDKGVSADADRAGGPSDPSLQAVSAVPALIADAEALHRFVCGRDFGFGEKPEPWEYVSAYRDAMTADGWSARPTYGSEPVESAAKLEREGFICQMLSRNKGASETRPERQRGLKRYETKINIWGPDGLAITPPFPYSFEGCVAALRHCHACGKWDVETQRVNFAGRVCADCLPEQRRLTERPGWCD